MKKHQEPNRNTNSAVHMLESKIVQFLRNISLQETAEKEIKHGRKNLSQHHSERGILERKSKKTSESSSPDTAIETHQLKNEPSTMNERQTIARDYQQF